MVIPTADAEPHAQSYPARRDWYGALAVVAITCVAFLPALQNGFVAWDDDKNFLQNTQFRGLGPDQFRWMWSTFHLGHYVPLTWMSLGLDYSLWGMNPFGYHLTNIAIHAATAALVYLVALRLLRLSPRSATDRPPLHIVAAFGALLFAIHPLRVESVAWITERRDVLSGLFYCSAVYAYLRCAHTADDSTHAPRISRWYLCAVVATICALLSKASAVTLPVALFLLSIYPLGQIGGTSGWVGPRARRAYVALTPFVVLAGATSIVAFVALQPEVQLPVPAKVAVSAYSLAFYLWKTVAPFGLSPLYAMPLTVNPLEPRYLIAIGSVFGIATAIFAVRKRVPAFAIGALAFALILFPLLGVHQNGPHITADRYTYNAAVVLALLAAAGLRAVYTRVGAPALAVGAAALVALGALTWRQSGVWHDSDSLWTQVLAVEPASPIAQNNYGNVLARRGAAAEALGHYQLAVAANPRYADAHDNIGVALAQLGKTDEAFGAFRTAVNIRPAFDEARTNWGVALASRGRFDEAIEQYRLALETNPSNALAHVNWGNALVRLGRTPEALPHYRDAITWRPDDVDAHHNFGSALALIGDLEGAIEQFTRTLELRPDHPEARQYLARVKALRGRSPASRP